MVFVKFDIGGTRNFFFVGATLESIVHDVSVNFSGIDVSSQKLISEKEARRKEFPFLEAGITAVSETECKSFMLGSAPID